MKSGYLFMAAATIVVAGLAIVGAGYFDVYPYTAKSRSIVHAGRQPAEPSLNLSSAGPESQIQSGQLSILQALDLSVLSVMNDKSMTNEEKFSYFWDGYQKNKSSIVLSTYYIDCLMSVVPLRHADILLTELDSTMTEAEIKIHLMQVLQSAYLIENGMSEDSRHRVLGAIKSNIHNIDPKVAGEAVLLYARMGVQDNLIAILGSALQRKIISPLDYIRESAFQLPNVSDPTQQNALVETLINAVQKSGSDESVPMLVNSLGVIIQSPSRLAKLDTVSKNLIVQYLAANEPEVLSDGINFDLVSAINYGNWLNSYAMVKSKSDAEVLAWITRQVTDANADSKKIVAVMTSPMAQDVVRLASESGKIDGMKHKVESEMAGQRPGTSAYSAYGAALELLQADGGLDVQRLYP